MAFAKPSLKGRALRYLAGREHSRAELTRKLKTHEETPGELTQVLDELEAKGFISEQRVAESVLNRRSTRLGSGRIRQEMQALGLAPDTIAAALAPLKANEMARALAVWQKKFGPTPPADAAARARQMRFMASRGFSTELITRVMRTASDETP